MVGLKSKSNDDIVDDLLHALSRDDIGAIFVSLGDEPLNPDKNIFLSLQNENKLMMIRLLLRYLVKNKLLAVWMKMITISSITTMMYSSPTCE